VYSRVAIIFSLIGCSDPGSLAESANDADMLAGVVRYEVGGLPDCALSRSDAELCGNELLTGSWAGGADLVPEWLFDYGGPLHARLSTFEQEKGEYECAGDADQALSVALVEYPGYADTITMFNDSDPRWYDVALYGGPGSVQALRVPNCGYFSWVADLRELWPAVPGGETEKEIDPAWMVKELPPVRSAFLDFARDIEVFRYSNSRWESSLLFAVGSEAGDDVWTFRSCRWDFYATQPKEHGDPYVHNVVQSDYIMNPSTGSARFRGYVVRQVACEEWAPAFDYGASQ